MAGILECLAKLKLNRVVVSVCISCEVCTAAWEGSRRCLSNAQEYSACDAIKHCREVTFEVVEMVLFNNKHLELEQEGSKEILQCLIGPFQIFEKITKRPQQRGFKTLPRSITNACARFTMECVRLSKQPRLRVVLSTAPLLEDCLWDNRRVLCSSRHAPCLCAVHQRIC